MPAWRLAPLFKGARVFWHKDLARNKSNREKPSYNKRRYRSATSYYWRRRTIPASYLENGTDDRHTWYNFHTRIEYAINDFLNIYLYNYPADYPQPGRQLQQTHYLVIIHTTTRLINTLKDELKQIQSRNSGWHTKKTLDKQFQIHGDRVQRPSKLSIRIGDYMEIKTTHRQNNTMVIANKMTYKQHHYHDYSVITSDLDMDEEVAKQMFSEIYQTSRDKRPGTIPHIHSFMIFMIEYCAQRTEVVMKKAGCTENEIKDAYRYFDNSVDRLFDRPNVRPLPQLQEDRHDYSEIEKGEEIDDDEASENRENDWSTTTT
eukprot:4835185-Amphidinium_carterae.2